MVRKSTSTLVTPSKDEKEEHILIKGATSSAFHYSTGGGNNVREVVAFIKKFTVSTSQRKVYKVFQQNRKLFH